MEESKKLAAQQSQQQQQQKQKLLLQNQLYQFQKLQQRQQQLFLLEQLDKQQIQQQQQQQAAMRFSSNIDVHLRAGEYMQNQPVIPSLQNANPTSGLSFMQHNEEQQNVPTQPIMIQQQLLQQQKLVRSSNNLGVQYSYQDAWRVCHPDFKRPFASLEDACERLLPYHVIADYEAEEEDRIINSDTTGQPLSRWQTWDNNIAARVAEFMATFENQAQAFNMINQKRGVGEFRFEERLMIENELLHEEKKTIFQLKAEMDREKAGREAQEARPRMAALVQAGQVRTRSQSHAEIIARNPLRANAVWNQGSHFQLSHEMGEPGRNTNPVEMMNGWGNNNLRYEREPFEDFLNDAENENGETLNTR